MAIHMPDTSVPMYIDQSQPRPETCTCYNCGEPVHLSHACMKPWKQRIQSTIPANADIKILLAEAMAEAMDAREAIKKLSKPRSQKRQRQIFRTVNGETH